MNITLNIVLFCATDRGLNFLLKIHQLFPSAKLIVISFSETQWEPRYLNNIQSATMNRGIDMNQFLLYYKSLEKSYIAN